MRKSCDEFEKPVLDYNAELIDILADKFHKVVLFWKI